MDLGGIAKNSVWIKVSIARSSPSCGASVASVAHFVGQIRLPACPVQDRARAQARFLSQRGQPAVSLWLPAGKIAQLDARANR